MKEDVKIKQLEGEFQNHNYREFFDILLNEYIKRVKRTVYSKGWYYNVYPFENEIDGFRKGRLLKNKPSKINNITEYGFDNDGRVILVIEHITSEICNYSFFSYIESQITVYKYVGKIPLLQNITMAVLSKTGLIDALYNWGKYGYRIDTYFCNSSDKIHHVHRKAKEHTSSQFIECDFLFKYNDRGLSAIEQSYDNGYNKIIYSI